MKQLYGTTATKAGLQAAIAVCQEQSQATRKVIFLLTDGYPNSGQEPDDEVSRAHSLVSCFLP